MSILRLSILLKNIHRIDVKKLSFLIYTVAKIRNTLLLLQLNIPFHFLTMIIARLKPCYISYKRNKQH